MTAEEIADLRRQHYNAAVTHVRRAHDDLMIVRVRPDDGVPEYQPGQYTLLGLGFWEPRVPHTQAERLTDDDLRKMAKRAYSISFPVLDDAGRLLRQAECDFLEFYVVLVRESPAAPPALTPRLFHLALHDRLFVGTKIAGHYTLASVSPEDDVVFLATGTGEAPHNAMIAHLLARGHSGRIVSAVCVRRLIDLGYRNAHVALERRFPNYRYLPLTTREPVNLDRSLSGYVGKQYIQNLVETGRLEAALGRPLIPNRTHVFLCGSPAMIGIPHVDENGRHVYQQSDGVVELLERRGFQIDVHGHAGTVHFEKYW